MAYNKLRIIELVSYVILIFGTLGDHLSTAIGLQNPMYYETNQFTVVLMSKQLWLSFDLLLIVLGVIIPYKLLRMRKDLFKEVLAFPLILGIARLSGCLINLSLIYM
ncbi:MAG: hypothetical protein QG670_2390 [Thermoproteota archaeon]|nr:hypothetical protein [Thermoproteota archaeon]